MCDFKLVRLKIKEKINFRIVAAIGYYSMSLANFYTVAAWSSLGLEPGTQDFWLKSPKAPHNSSEHITLGFENNLFSG